MVGFRFAIGLCLGGAAKLDAHRDIARHALDRVGQVEHSLDRIETSDVPNPDLAAAGRCGGRGEIGSLTPRRFTTTFRRSAIGDHDVRGSLRQDHEPLDDVEHRALPESVALDEVGHRHRGPDRSRQASREGGQPGRHGREGMRGAGTRAAMLELALGASPDVDPAVAYRPPLPHQRAPLAQEAQAARMGGRDDAAARSPGGKDFLQSQPGHERVEVNDVGADLAQPAVEMLGAAHDGIALSFLACGEFRHRIPEDDAAIEIVRPGRTDSGLRRGDQHVVAAATQLARKLGDVDLRSTDAVGVIPADGLDNLHGVCIKRHRLAAANGDQHRVTRVVRIEFGRLQLLVREAVHGGSGRQGSCRVPGP